MKMTRNITTAALTLATALTLSSCGDDFLNPETLDSVTDKQIADIAESGGEALLKIVKSTMAGAYQQMIEYQSNHDVFGEMSVGLAGDMMTEDIVMDYSTWFFFDYQIDNRNADYRRPNRMWSYCYTTIAACNEVIGTIPPDMRNPEFRGLRGEALALRAYMFHSLIQRFQQTYAGNENKPGIVLPLVTNDDREPVLGRASVREVYDKILVDYDSAVSFLKDAPKRTGKTSIDHQVAAGLFARALMTVQDWERAAKYAAIAKSGYALMTGTEAADDGFNNINNKEWMWGADITGETTTMFASFFSHVCSYDEGYGESVYAPKMIDARLYDQMNGTDSRRAWFKAPKTPVDKDSKVTEENAPVYCNFKFKKVDGWLADYVFMRAAEMYLIEAEALAQQGKTADAYTVLKELMDNRDPSWATNRTIADVEDVFLQKRLELWGEGRIFYDYLRLKKGVYRDYEDSNHIEKLMLNAGNWRFIYQIPQTEIDNNPAISESDQNP